MHSGYSLEARDDMVGACRSYESILPDISDPPSGLANATEYRVWTELLLSSYAMLFSRRILAHSRQIHGLLSDNAEIPPASLLAPFRAYAKDWNARHVGRTENARALKVWRSYYDVLSVLVQSDVVQPVFESRLQQFTELKKVESFYEHLLMQKVSFPRADQANTQVEGWVDQVMANWRVVSNQRWREEELGQGGRAMLGRGVLEVGFASFYSD